MLPVMARTIARTGMALALVGQARHTAAIQDRLSGK
jgi:hypothetical protein